MRQDLSALQKYSLFRGKTLKEIEDLLCQIPVQIRTYQKNEIIISEFEPVTSMGIVLSGSIESQKIYPSGKVLTLIRISEGQAFGEAMLFSRTNAYPVTIISRELSKVLLISRQAMIDLFTNDTKIMALFLESISDRIMLLNQKIETLSLGSLRQKIAHFLILQAKRQRTNYIELPFTKQVLSDHLSVPRPSLSRELGKMQAEGIIDYSRTHINILDMDSLEKTCGMEP